MLLAGIDIGTLTCRLLIAEVDTDFSLREIASDRRILRLGEGVDQRGCLSAAAISRVVKTLGEWRERIETYSLAGAIVVATSAVRESRNREEFLASVKKDVGFEIEVLSGEEEARRTFLGIASGLPAEVESFLGIDIGGGSTEFMRAFKAREPNHLQVFSLDVGVVRLTERIFQTDDPPSEQGVLAAERIIQAELGKIRTALGNLSRCSFVGTAGTITTLAAMAQKLPRYETARIHNFRLSLETVQKLEKEIRIRTRSKRREMPGLEDGREDVIVAGTLIFRTVMQRLGFQECLVSDYGLREGILVQEASRLRGLKSGI